MHWISLDTAPAIHQLQIAEHGGLEGIRDLALLESALARPKNLYAYDDTAGMAALASAYAFGIAKNHPFLDGNKRVALVVLRTFMILNGSDIEATQKEKYLAIVALSEGSLTETDLTRWIEKHSVR